MHLLQERALSGLKEAEEAILATRSCPFLRYLIKSIYPTLTNALLEVIHLRPEDPLDFLVSYLIATCNICLLKYALYSPTFKLLQSI